MPSPAQFLRLGAAVTLCLAGLDAIGAMRVQRWVGADHELLERNPALAETLRREDDPTTLISAWARVAVQDALDLSRFEALSDEQAAQEAAAVSARLEKASARAAAIATERPWRGQPWLVLGATEFLRTWREQGSSTAAREAWRPLLERARSQAGGDHLPRRVLALAWLNDWRNLESDERPTALEAIQSALEDPATFHALLPGWLAANARSDVDAALAILPDRASTWEAVANWWFQRRQPSRALEAWQRRDTTRLVEARAALDRALGMIRGGAARRARGELSAVLTLPPRRDHLELFVAAARALPGGPADPGLVPHLEGWLEWGVELAVHGRPALPADVLQRLGAAVDPTLGAAATAAGGDLVRAQTVMRRANIHQSRRAWRELLYLSLAGACIERRDGLAALQQLEELPRERRLSPEAQRLEHSALRLISASTPAASLAPPTTAWRIRDRRMVLDLDAPSGAQLELDLAAHAGTILEISVDGQSHYELVARPHTIALPLPAEGGPVLVAIETLRGSAAPPVFRLRLPT